MSDALKKKWRLAVAKTKTLDCCDTIEFLGESYGDYEGHRHVVRRDGKKLTWQPCPVCDLSYAPQGTGTLKGKPH